jgi:PfaD family protein
MSQKAPSDIPTSLPTRIRARSDAFGAAGILGAIEQMRSPLWIVREGPGGRLGAQIAGEPGAGEPSSELVGQLPPLFPEWLGDRFFCEAHQVRFPYAIGEMAKGLTTAKMVIEAARAGFIGFFGAGGLSPERIEAAVTEIAREVGDRPFGFNLIHSPDEPDLEDAAVDVFLKHGVRRVSASAFMRLSLPVVRYAVSGLHKDPRGRVLRRNYLFAKVSRPEVARRFLSPAPAEMLEALVAAGRISREEAELAKRVPLASDLTIEGDSGGHTDNRPLNVIFPAIAALRDELTAANGYDRPIRLGAAGGLGSPSAVAAAFAMGASYVLTGSVNQVAVESGLGATGKKLLRQAGVADVTMAPSADMFEIGARVQVLKRGTLFGTRAQKLYELYSSLPGIEAIEPAVRAKLEDEIFRMPLDKIWEETEKFWSRRNPRQVERAKAEPKHRMALCFRWYLGQGTRWAIEDVAERRTDFQIWCGPAIGSFNEWARGSFLEEADRCTVAQIGLNLLEGAAQVTRAQQLRAIGVPVPPAAFHFRPRPLA